jgi:hypothetical protein
MLWVIDQWGMENARRLWEHQGYDGQPYSTAKSAFWRVIKKIVVDGLRIGDNDTWPSHIVWTNLYKIAPAKGGNPKGHLREMQIEDGRLLLETEVKHFGPRRILFITGFKWVEPFICGMFADVRGHRGGGFIEASGVSPTGIRVVVATRPDRRPEAMWSQAVVKAFSALG